ncbi:MAG: peptide methionine sulfoxide reductase [Saprospiraceae bacterium]
MTVKDLIAKIPLGYSEGRYKNEKYGISKQVFNAGKSFKIYAKALGGKDFISLNFYLTQDKELLKPCEMPTEKVIDFLRVVVIENE